MQNSRFRNAKPQLPFFLQNFLYKSEAVFQRVGFKNPRNSRRTRIPTHPCFPFTTPPFIHQQKNAKALRFSIFLFSFSSANPLYVSTWEGGE